MLGFRLEAFNESGDVLSMQDVADLIDRARSIGAGADSWVSAEVNESGQVSLLRVDWTQGGGEEGTTDEQTDQAGVGEAESDQTSDDEQASNDDSRSDQHGNQASVDKTEHGERQADEQPTAPAA